MLVEQIDMVGLEALERGLGHQSDVFRTAVHAPLNLPARKAEFRRYDHLVTKRCQGFAYQFFIDERAVGLGGIEKGDTPLEGRSDQPDGYLLVRGRPITIAQSHTAIAERRHFETVATEFAFLHWYILSSVVNSDIACT